MARANGQTRPSKQAFETMERFACIMRRDNGMNMVDKSTGIAALAESFYCPHTEQEKYSALYIHGDNHLHAA